MALIPTDPAGQKKVLAIVVAVALAGVYWYVVHTGATEEVERLESRLEQLEQRNTVARARAAQGGPELEQRVTRYEAHIARLEQLIPTSEEVPDLLHQMAQHAQEANVDLALVRPDAEVPTGLYIRSSYDMGVIGSYHDVGRFLTAIGSLPRIVTPIDLRLSARQDTDRSGALLLDARFRIQTYVIPPAMATTEETPDARS